MAMTFLNRIGLPSLSIAAALLGLFAFAPGQDTLSQADKLAALREPVTLLPYGQRIQVSDIAGTEMVMSPWMSPIPDTYPISRVSIPGTHDAGTALGRTGITRCHCTTIGTQLMLGIRGFDVRLRLVNDNLLVYHGEEFQSQSFEAVLTAMTQFLTAHPKEFLVMRIREESKAIDPTQSFESAFEIMAHSKRFQKFFYLAHTRTEIPTVGKVRGKIVLLDNYGKLTQAINYPNPSMRVQDDYDTTDMPKKFREIVENFESAMADKGATRWNVNYTSSSTLGVDQLASSVANNAKIDDYLTHKHGTLGLVFMNFPGVALIRKIVQSNF